MPQIFKALASILVWVLWLAGMVMGLGTLAMGLMAGHLFNPAEAAPMSYAVHFAVSLAFGIGAAVVMLIRKKLE